MPNNPLVFNETRNCRWSLKQARKAVTNCAARWIEFEVSFAELTPAEAIKARNEQAKQLEPLPLFELHGLIFQSPLTTPQHYELIAQANRFCAESKA